MKNRACFDISFLESMPYAGSDFRVLFVLMFHHNIERGAFPFVKTIALLTGLHRTTVERSLASLEKQGLSCAEVVKGKKVWRLPVNERNDLMGGASRWDKEIPDSKTARSPGKKGKSVGANLHKECAISHTDDAISHKNAAEMHRQMCENAAPINNARASSEATPKNPLRDPREATHQPAADDFEKWWNGYPNKAGKAKAEGYYTTWRSTHSQDDLTQARDRYKAAKKKAGNDTFANGSTFLNPKPQGDSANISDFLDGNYTPPPPSCGTCANGGEEPTYCSAVMETIYPDNKPCAKHKAREV